MVLGLQKRVKRIRLRVLLPAMKTPVAMVGAPVVSVSYTHPGLLPFR